VGVFPTATSDGDALWQFTVSAPSATPIIDAELQVFLSLSGPGTFSDTEAFPGTTIPSLTATDLLLHSEPISPAVVSLNVTDHLSVIPGGDVSAIDRQFSQPVSRPIPEPASLSILAVSLLGMGVAYRRFRR
jgi:hypothetical protein